jgi:hypothetical protein
MAWCLETQGRGEVCGFLVGVQRRAPKNEMQIKLKGVNTEVKLLGSNIVLWASE